jgi:hypothetical protein
VTVTKAVVPERLPAEIFAGLTEQAVVGIVAGPVQVRITSSGNVELAGSVDKVSVALPGF